MKRLLQQLLLLGILVLVGQVFLSLEYSALPAGKTSVRTWLRSIRVTIPAANRYKPGNEELQAQRYQQLDGDVGFLWKAGLDSSDQALLAWGDQEPAQIITDTFGFINSADAVRELRDGRTPDVIGLGASFMQGANAVFYDYCSINGLFYYNMATHRHTLPMFNTVLERYAVPLHPRWIIYELNEASPLLINDYRAWKESGMDWFTYHSGTWAGPPVTGQYHLGPLERVPALDNLAVALLKKVWRKKAVSPGTTDEQREACRAAILQADSIARVNGSNLLLLYIPSKETMYYGKSRMTPMIDDLLPGLRQAGVRILDLREPFNATDDPRMLYYVQDGHWNKDGILVAVRALDAFMQMVF